MQSTETLEEILAEGRRQLEAGDKPRALAHFVKATRLKPQDGNIWLWRAEATANPTEAAACLEQALTINPEDDRVRERLTSLRLKTLQEDARINVTPPPESLGHKLWGRFRFFDRSSPVRRTAALFLVALAVVSGLGLVAAVGAVSNPGVQTGGEVHRAPLVTATEEAFVLPPTWTPRPIRTATRTPVPEPTREWKTIASVNVRSGPGTTFPILGLIRQGTVVVPVAKSPDSKFLQIEYPDRNKLAWVAASYVNVDREALASLPAAASLPIAPAAKLVVKPTATPLRSPTPRVEFVLGRQPEALADCSKPWRVLGTVYDSPSGAQRVNGILVRVWAFNQLQGTVMTGRADPNLPGHWEWRFNRGAEIIGQVAIVNSDGSWRSDAIPFHLTVQCSGAGAANQTVIDFVRR
jgi:hypothetical protein